MINDIYIYIKFKYFLCHVRAYLLPTYCIVYDGKHEKTVVYIIYFSHDNIGSNQEKYFRLYGVWVA